MKSVSALKASDISDIKLVSFDVDGVLVEKGTEIVEKDNFMMIRNKKISPELVDKLNRLKKHVHINISSGRSLHYLKDVFEPILWENASLQGENGLFTLIAGNVIQHGALTFEELEALREIRKEIRSLRGSNINIRGFEPKQFLLSVHCFDPEPQIEEVVKRYNKNDAFSIKWSSEAYNIFPKRFSKGTGLKALSKILDIDLKQTIVVGNDTNDKEAVEGTGISVTTDPESLTADYFTDGKLELGGENLVNRLLEVFEKS